MSASAELRAQADLYIAEERYLEAIALYEQIIALEPEEVTHYWQLGLALFLQGEVAEAQLIWMTPLVEAEPDQEWERSRNLLQVLLTQAENLNHAGKLQAAAQLGRFCLELTPEDPAVALSAATWLQHTGWAENLIESIPLAEFCLTASDSYLDQVVSTHLILTALMSTCGDWPASEQYYQIYKHLLANLAQAMTASSPNLLEANLLEANLLEADEPKVDGPQVDRETLPNLLGMGGFLLYLEDNPRSNRPIRNQFAAICQSQLRRQVAIQGKTYHQSAPARSLLSSPSTRPLKIGYLSESLRQHSIGWLIRWLLTYHDRDQFDIHLYSLLPAQDAIQTHLRSRYGDRFHDLPPTAVDIADRIYQDGIDILVELDSLTSLSSCGAIALKPAPIQVNWLGYDASGIPGVDYFIADPYVLPEDAQDYYQETIWRLPQTYIAVDGFEVHTPSLRRDQLNIPTDAIVYLSSQSGLKRNPDNIRLQLQIIKAVPNSYFLIKSWRAAQDQLAAFFGQLADEVGVSRDRLRFLPGVPSESVHRANLGLADVVLDTYPYNGATTTLEALWMELPIVTRVGEQFSARNSYTLMMNAGITEGLAWSDAAYMEWGVRLGEDAALRQAIAYRLRRSRHTSPLWHGRHFTQEMEKAYQQMWERYKG